MLRDDEDDLVGVVFTIAKNDFATAFCSWLERSKKCVRIGGDYGQKSYKNKYPQIMFGSCFIDTVRVDFDFTSYSSSTRLIL